MEHVFDELESTETLSAELEAYNQQESKKKEEDRTREGIIQDTFGFPPIGPERPYVMGAFEKLSKAEQVDFQQATVMMAARMKKAFGKIQKSLKALAAFLKSSGL